MTFVKIDLFATLGTNDTRLKCGASVYWVSYFLIVMLNVFMLSVVAPLRLVRDKNSSLFCRDVCENEKKFFLTSTPGLAGADVGVSDGGKVWRHAIHRRRFRLDDFDVASKTSASVTFDVNFGVAREVVGSLKIVLVLKTECNNGIFRKLTRFCVFLKRPSLLQVIHNGQPTVLPYW